MRALVVLLVAGCAAPPACYRPSASGRGWKRVELPARAPHLAARGDVDQLRSGEAAIAWSDWREGGEGDVGRSWFRLDVGGSGFVEVRFAARLGGANVEVVGWRGGGRYTLLAPTRENRAALRWELEPGTDAVTVLVHNHLRAPPRLVGWRTGSLAHSDDPRFTRPRSLYYFDEGSGVLLCEAPDRPLGLRLSRLRGGSPVRDVALSPTPLTRVFYQ